ncbi:hypothetical protein [Paraliomyxa miuraensis]|uniref:hypothetical protein n=1 Tax=Paraliomyxa miuraensis TaxID=376150 RepID=UPI002252B449|nr:hypothetical protein [Paraliomyxa miuraensis]MCX4241940.1 hypothetical protein [Paraliomyxa miuraensis]
MMATRVRVFVLAAALAPLWGCASSDTATADPEAAQLDPPVVIVDEPEPEPEPVSEDAAEASPDALAKDPSTEVITFAGEDADPGMADEVTSAPKREELPSMMSDVIKGPNK